MICVESVQVRVFIPNVLFGRKLHMSGTVTIRTHFASVGKHVFLVG